MNGFIKRNVWLATGLLLSQCSAFGQLGLTRRSEELRSVLSRYLSFDPFQAELRQGANKPTLAIQLRGIASTGARARLKESFPAFFLTVTDQRGPLRGATVVVELSAGDTGAEGVFFPRCNGSNSCEYVTDATGTVRVDNLRASAFPGRWTLGYHAHQGERSSDFVYFDLMENIPLDMVGSNGKPKGKGRKLLPYLIAAGLGAGVALAAEKALDRPENPQAPAVPPVPFGISFVGSPSIGSPIGVGLRP